MIRISYHIGSSKTDPRWNILDEIETASSISSDQSEDPGTNDNRTIPRALCDPNHSSDNGSLSFYVAHDLTAVQTLPQQTLTNQRQARQSVLSYVAALPVELGRIPRAADFQDISDGR